METAEEYLQVWAQDVTDKIRDNLVSKDAWFDRSTLAQSIEALPVEKISGGYAIKIQMNDYGEYIDSGRGASETGLISPIEKIEDWITRRGIAIVIKPKTKRRSTSKLKSRLSPILAARRSFAFAIANTHKDEGFKSKGFGFYSEIITDESLEKLAEGLADKFGGLYEAEILEA